MGMDKDLNLAMKAATQEAVNFLMQEKGLDARDAYALASIGVDFRVAEAVNLVQVIFGMIPKSLFRTKQDYWFKP
jgi:acetamidase/formamidase